MFRKNFYLTLIFTFVFFATSAIAQDAAITGKVMMKGDSATTPLGGVTVVCYLLTDFTVGGETKCGSVKSGDDGTFSITGLTVKTKYVLAAYGPGIGPRVTLPVEANDKEKQITATPGDGNTLTKLEVWQAFAFSDGGGGATGDQKAAQKLYETELAKKSAKNEEVKANNEKLEVLLKEGNAAYESKDYDTAIVKYAEGYKLAPDFLGSAPVFLNNRAAALKNRAVINYNAAAKSKDAAALASAKVAAGKDLAETLKVVGMSYKLLKNAPASERGKQQTHKTNIFNAVDYGRDAIRIMVQIDLVDMDQVVAAKEVTAGYLKVQKDKVKSGQAQAALAGFIMASGDYEAAAAEFRKALDFSDSDPDVLAGLGLALYTVAYESNNKAQQQESLNYMDRYLKVAPKNHRMRNGIVGAVDDLTKNHKLKPKKLK